MCDVCKDARQELKTFLTELADKYPGTTVKGQPVKHDHHATVAVVAEADERMTALALDMLQQQPGGMDSLLNSLFGGGQKISEGN